MRAFVGFVIFVVGSTIVLEGLVLMGIVPAFTIKALAGLVMVELCFAILLKNCAMVALERS